MSAETSETENSIDAGGAAPDAASSNTFVSKVIGRHRDTPLSMRYPQNFVPNIGHLYSFNLIESGS